MKKYLALSIAILVLGGGAYFSQRWFAEEFIFVQETPGVVEEAGIFVSEETIEASKGKQPQVQAAAETVAKSADLIAPSSPESKSPENPPTTYTIPILSKGTALDSMHAYAAAQADFSFSGRNFPGLGFFVEEMGGLKNGDGNYWFLYVNGESSQKGASQTFVAPGDIVEWHYQKNY